MGTIRTMGIKSPILEVGDFAPDSPANTQSSVVILFHTEGIVWYFLSSSVQNYCGATTGAMASNNGKNCNLDDEIDDMSLNENGSSKNRALRAEIPKQKLVPDPICHHRSPFLPKGVIKTWQSPVIACNTQITSLDESPRRSQSTLGQINEKSSMNIIG